MATQHNLPAGFAPRYDHGKQLAQRIFLATMAKLDVRRAMLDKLQYRDRVLMAGGESFPLLKAPYVIAFGKAAARMAAVVEEILAGEIAAGVIVAPSAPRRKLRHFADYEAGHPYPNPSSIAGAAAALELVSGLSPDDLVIFLVSGGGSALFEAPLDPSVTLADLIEFNRILVTGGMPIEEMNVLRKHISAVKGGRLAAAALPARQLTIYISDVPEGFPSMVASGPTMPDESTIAQCYELVERYELKLPARIRGAFESLQETPKPGDAAFARSSYFCLLSNRDAVDAARSLAEEAGFDTGVECALWDADYKDVVDRGLRALDEFPVSGSDRPVCLVIGGEVTCRAAGRGEGGRNLSLALYAALKISGRKHVVLSGATDGRDGNSPSSGAVSDGNTIARARALHLDPERYLAGCDAYHFFRTLGDTIDTGFTDNNVRDLRLLMSFE